MTPAQVRYLVGYEAGLDMLEHRDVREWWELSHFLDRCPYAPGYQERVGWIDAVQGRDRKVKRAQ